MLVEPPAVGNVNRPDFSSRPVVDRYLVGKHVRLHTKEQARVLGIGGFHLCIQLVICVLFLGHQKAAFSLRPLVACNTAVDHLPLAEFIVGEKLFPAIESFSVEQVHESGKIGFRISGFSLNCECAKKNRDAEENLEKAFHETTPGE